MRPHRLYDITGVAQGGTAIIRLPLGVSIGSVVLDYKTAANARADKASVDADFDELRVIVNGDVIQRLRGNEIIDYGMLYYGQDFHPGCPIINFAAPWANRPEFGKALGLGTAMGVDSALVEIDLAGDAGAAIELKAWAMVESGRNTDGSLAGPGVLRRFRRFTPPPATLGQNEWSQLPLRGRLLALHLHGAAAFDDVKLQATGGDAAGVTVWEATHDIVAALALQNVQVPRGVRPNTIPGHAGNAQQAAFSIIRALPAGDFSLDLAPDGDVFGGGLRLDDLAELRIQANATTAGAYTVLAETLE